MKNLQDIYKYEYMAINRKLGVSFEETIKPDNFVVFLAFFYRGYFINREALA